MKLLTTYTKAALIVGLAFLASHFLTSCKSQDYGRITHEFSGYGPGGTKTPGGFK